MTFFLVDQNVGLLCWWWAYDKKGADFHVMLLDIEINIPDYLDLPAGDFDLADAEDSLLWEFSEESVLVSSAWHHDVPALAG